MNFLLGFHPWVSGEFTMTNECEWNYLHQANCAREKALLADSALKSEWLRIANLWETLALEYCALRQMQFPGGEKPH